MSLPFDMPAGLTPEAQRELKRWDEDRQALININESTYIPAGNKHRLENPGKLELVLIEVQSGEYVGEDDIVRFEDKYGRA